MEAEQVRATLVLLGFETVNPGIYPVSWKMDKGDLSVSYAEHVGRYFLSWHAAFIEPDEIIDEIGRKLNDSR